MPAPHTAHSPVKHRYEELCDHPRRRVLALPGPPRKAVHDLPLPRTRPHSSRYVPSGREGDAQDKASGHAARAEAQASSPPEGFEIPGRPLTSRHEQAPSRRHPPPRSAHRRVRGRMLLALVPCARTSSEDQPRLVAEKAGRGRAPGPRHGCRADRGRLVGSPGVGARRSRSRRRQERAPGARSEEPQGQLRGVRLTC